METGSSSNPLCLENEEGGGRERDVLDLPGNLQTTYMLDEHPPQRRLRRGHEVLFDDTTYVDEGFYQVNKRQRLPRHTSFTLDLRSGSLRSSSNRENQNRFEIASSSQEVRENDEQAHE